MIPLYRTTDMEGAICALASTFRLVYVRQRYTNLAPIRLRLNGLVPHKIYLWQRKDKWRESGGIHVSPAHQYVEFPFDAVFFTEAPKCVDFLDRACQSARICAVVYYPPTWRLHEETIAYRLAAKPEVLRRAGFDQLERVKQLLDASPEFTPAEATRLRHAPLLVKPPMICAPERAAPVARAAGKDQRVP